MTLVGRPGAGRGHTSLGAPQFPGERWDGRRSAGRADPLAPLASARRAAPAPRRMSRPPAASDAEASRSPHLLRCESGSGLTDHLRRVIQPDWGLMVTPRYRRFTAYAKVGA